MPGCSLADGANRPGRLFSHACVRILERRQQACQRSEIAYRTESPGRLLTYTAALIRQGVHEPLNGARIVYGTEGPRRLPAHAITRVGQCAEKRGYGGP